MKIGIDLRFIKKDLYSRFILQLVKGIINSQEENKYTIYLNDEIENIDINNNVIIKKVDIKNASLKEQTEFLNILKKDENNLMIFFNHFKPIFYKGEYITFIGSLKDIYYMNFDSYIKKYKYLYLMEKNIQKSYKIICLDQNTKNELIEKFNIKEDKINMIDGFFPQNNEEEIEANIDEIPLNIKAKYGINNDYFIYSGGISIEKNYEKLVNVFSRLEKNGKNIDLVFLGDNISKSINLRNLILGSKLEKKCIFLGTIPLSEKELIYKNSLGTIFPSFYEPFPFRLSEPISFGTNIVSSDLKNIKDIFGEKIQYFSPISVNSIYQMIDTIVNNINKTNKNSYKDIIEKYTVENTTKQFIEVIK